MARRAAPDDAWGNRLRRVEVWNDKQALARLAGEAPAAELSPQLADLVAATGADELLVSTSTYDPAARVESFAALARLADLPVAERLPA